jgi:hypothetical protein
MSTPIGAIAMPAVERWQDDGELAAPLTRLGGSRTAETAGTARNWATVSKLLALCDG